MREVPTTIPNSLPALSSVSEPIECSCVRYANSLSPDIPLIDAIDYPLTTINPEAGDIIKLQYYNATTSRYNYHLARIEEITEEGYKVQEANYERCKAGERIIAKDDEKILGFFSVDLWREIQKLPKDIKDTLYCESRFSHYKQNAVLRGKDGEWGLFQWKKSSWQFMTEKRRELGVKPILLDILNPFDQLTMTKFAFELGFQNWWSCYSPKGVVN